MIIIKKLTLICMRCIEYLIPYHSDGEPAMHGGHAKSRNNLIDLDSISNNPDIS